MLTAGLKSTLTGDKVSLLLLKNQWPGGVVVNESANESEYPATENVGAGVDLGFGVADGLGEVEALGIGEAFGVELGFGVGLVFTFGSAVGFGEGVA